MVASRRQVRLLSKQPRLVKRDGASDPNYASPWHLGPCDAESEEPLGLVPLTLSLAFGSLSTKDTKSRSGQDSPTCGYIQVLREIAKASAAFWLRRHVRRRVLKQLAEECAKFGPLVRRRAAELRADAARQRLDLLRGGDTEGYETMLRSTKESRLREILDETDRILRDLDAPAPPQPKKAMQQPSVLAGGRLLPYQRQGLAWLTGLIDRDMSGILADDMGLGKTVQTLSLLGHLKENCDQHGPHLIVTPMSVLPHWVDEITTWLPTFRYQVLRGPHDRTNLILQEFIRKIGEPDHVELVITTYETVSSHQQLISQFPWNCVIVDEGHRLKNFRTKFSQSCRGVPSRHRLLLTGTPLQNSLKELWSLLAFVAPRAFGSLEDFEKWFALPPLPSIRLDDDKGKANNAEKQTQPAEQQEEGDSVAGLLSEEEELLIIQRLHKVMRPFLLRRTKEMVLDQLPEKQEMTLWVPLSAWQRSLYRQGLRRVATHPNGNSSEVQFSSVMQLRKAVNHPYQCLVRAIPGRKTPMPAIVDDLGQEALVRASGKFEFLDRLLPKLWRFNHKILIFSQTSFALDLLQKLLAKHGLRYERLDGNMALPRRKEAIATFRDDPEIAVMLLTTRAGGVGLNLQSADTVILFDSDWNPQVDLQAMDRAHRIGQLKPVRVIRLMTPTTLDRGLVARCSSKRDIARKVISAGQFHRDDEEAAPTGHDDVLRDLLREARSSNEGMSNGKPTGLREANELLARSPEEFEAFEAADLELLGPEAADGHGVAEELVARLERCGRLFTSSEMRRLPADCRPDVALKRAANAEAARAAKRRRRTR